MRPIHPFALAFSLLLGAPASAQIAVAPPAAQLADVSTPEAIVAALYDVISGPAGQQRNWDRLRSLFAAGARMVPSSAGPNAGFRALTPDEYIARGQKTLLEHGFHEREIHRTVERFGPVVHVFSTYEARRDGDTDPFVRGVNSIQLVHDGSRWWILNLAWSAETPEQKLPAKYLP